MSTKTQAGAAPTPATAGAGAAFRPVETGSPRRLSARRRQQLAGWLFLAPAIAYLLFAFALPIVYNVMLSFERTSPATIANFTAPFAGLDNYRFILHDPTSRAAIVHTFEFTVGSLVFQFIIGFALALLFSLRFPGRTFARSLIIVPWLLPLIVTGVIFRFLFQAEGGAVNQLLTNLGLTDHPIQWLNDPHLALWTILIANIWLGIPFFTLLLYSALQDVPVEVKEAADHRRRRPLAKASPRHRADHPAGDRGHVAPRVRIHREGVRPRDRSDRRRPGQLHPADHDLVLQPLVPGILLRRGRGTQQRAARAGADLRARCTCGSAGTR